jgi:hypothetical protein
MQTEFREFTTPYWSRIVEVLQEESDKKRQVISAWQFIYVGSFYFLIIEIYTWKKKKKK